MIEDFIESVLVIDDKMNEVEPLIKLLEERDINVKYYHPEDLLLNLPKLRKKKLIFIDLYIDETKGVTDNISLIRRIFSNCIGKQYSSYGIVLWTKHPSDIAELKTRLSKDQERYVLPAFIMGLDKQKYLRSGNYNDVWSDLENGFANDIAASFFIHWDILVRESRDNSINAIYSLVKDYNTQNKQMEFILYELAKNHLGIPGTKVEQHNLNADTFKAFGDILHYEISKNTPQIKSLFSSNISFTGTPDEKNIIYAEINSKLLIDFNVDGVTLAIPGNVYEVLDEHSPFYIKEFGKIDNPKLINDVLEGEITRIVIEVSPPCDFSMNKKIPKARFVGGIIVSYSKKNHDEFRGECYYKDLYPILIDKEKSPKMVVFDFRYFGFLDEEEIKQEQGKYKLVFRAKDKLFADILQKLSSFTARLGISAIH